MKDSINEDIVVIDELADKNNLEKYTSYYYLLNHWMKLLEEGIRLSSYFDANGYYKIAVYGNGDIGKHLVTQLQEDSKNILYVINRDNIFYKDYIYKIKDDIVRLPLPDVIVVTPLMEYLSIKMKLKNFFDTKIISIEEIILSL